MESSMAKTDVEAELAAEQSRFEVLVAEHVDRVRVLLAKKAVA